MKRGSVGVNSRADFDNALGNAGSDYDFAGKMILPLQPYAHARHTDCRGNGVGERGAAFQQFRLEEIEQPADFAGIANGRDIEIYAAVAPARCGAAVVRADAQNYTTEGGVRYFVDNRHGAWQERSVAETHLGGEGVGEVMARQRHQPQRPSGFGNGEQRTVGQRHAFAGESEPESGRAQLHMQAYHR